MIGNRERVKMPSKLYGIESLSRLISAIILTGRVKGCEPLSAFLIAPPESGKTSIVAEKQCKSVVIFTDVTGGGLLNLCKYHPEVTHIVLNDLTVITGHSKRTGNYFFSILNAMTEEGLQATAFPGAVDVYQGSTGKRAIIGCCTIQLVSDGRHWWNKIGLSSRILPICYQQSSDLILRIQNGIKSESLDGVNPKTIQKNISLQVPEAHVIVKASKTVLDRLHFLSRIKAAEFKEAGHRRLKQYIALAKGHALLRSWKNAQVTEKDLQFIEEIQSFISYDTPKEI